MAEQIDTKLAAMIEYSVRSGGCRPRVAGVVAWLVCCLDATRANVTAVRAVLVVEDRPIVSRRGRGARSP